MPRIRQSAEVAALLDRGADYIGPRLEQERAEAARAVASIDPPAALSDVAAAHFRALCEAVQAQGPLLPEHAHSIWLAAVALEEVDAAREAVARHGRFVVRGRNVVPTGAALYLSRVIGRADGLLSKLMLTRLHSRMLAPLRAAGTDDSDPFADL